MRVYLIVYKKEITSGQGQTDVVYALVGPNSYAPTYTYPAFSSYEEAEKYLKNLRFNSHLSIFPMEVVQ